MCDFGLWTASQRARILQIANKVAEGDLHFFTMYLANADKARSVRWVNHRIAVAGKGFDYDLTQARISR